MLADKLRAAAEQPTVGPRVIETVGTIALSGTAVSVNLPSSILANDLLIMFYNAGTGSNAAIVTPTGWRLLAEALTPMISVLCCVADGSEGATITVNTSDTGYMSTFNVMQLRGYKSIDVIGAFANDSTSPMANAGITPLNDGLLIGCWGIRANEITPVAVTAGPSGMTLANISSGYISGGLGGNDAVTNAVYYQTQSAVATGSRQITTSEDANSAKSILFQVCAASETTAYLSVAHETTPFASVYKWSAAGFGDKFSNPDTLPGTVGRGTAFASNGNHIGFAHTGIPYMSVYPWSSSGFGTRVSTTGVTLPTGIAYGIAFSPASDYVAVAHTTAPFITMYPWNGAYGTKLANPGVLPAGNAYSVAFSPDGSYVSVGQGTTPFISTYPFTSTAIGTRVTSPGTLPAGIGQGVTFSPAGDYIALAHGTTPFISVYPWSSGSYGTRIATTGVTLPTGNGASVAFSPNGNQLAVAHATTPFVTAYPWTGAYGTKFTNPATGSLPTGAGNGVAFAPDGSALAVAHTTAPFVTAYRWSSSGFGIKFASPATLPTGIGRGVAFKAI